LNMLRLSTRGPRLRLLRLLGVLRLMLRGLSLGLLRLLNMLRLSTRGPSLLFLLLLSARLLLRGPSLLLLLLLGRGWLCLLFVLSVGNRGNSEKQQHCRAYRLDSKNTFHVDNLHTAESTCLAIAFGAALNVANQFWQIIWRLTCCCQTGDRKKRRTK
jgi:hypothetical protein